MHNSVSITMRGTPVDGMGDALAALASVRSVDVKQGGGFVRLQVFPKGKETIIEEVSRMVRERGWAIEELRVERGQLDEVFRRVTVGDSAPD
jgi:ABC-2 type transport system ATP-binding protein